MTTPHHIYLKVKQLLKETSLSHLSIACHTGISKQTVITISKEKHERTAPHQTAPHQPVFSGPYVRCLTCGGMVKMPCLACDLLGKT